MTDFLITMMTLYPWFTWGLVFLAAVGLGYGSLWLAGGVTFVSSWMGYRRAVWHWKAAVRESGCEDGRLCPSCAAVADKVIRITDDPPEYQHPEVTRVWRPESGEDWIPDDDGPDWDGPPDDWSPAAEWGEHPERAMGSLAAILIRAHEIGMLNDDDQLPDGPPVEREGSRYPGEYNPLMLPDDGPPRCNNADCYRYGEPHGGACDVAPTMPAACYADGPAMPPQPVREYLHPAIMDDLERAGFSEHETTDGAVESMFTRAQAREVQAMITDGVIPAEGRKSDSG